MINFLILRKINVINFYHKIMPTNKYTKIININFIFLEAQFFFLLKKHNYKFIKTLS